MSLGLSSFKTSFCQDLIVIHSRHYVYKSLMIPKWTPCVIGIDCTSLIVRLDSTNTPSSSTIINKRLNPYMPMPTHILYDLITIGSSLFGVPLATRSILGNWNTICTNSSDGVNIIEVNLFYDDSLTRILAQRIHRTLTQRRVS
jgi:hypothetical protein